MAIAMTPIQPLLDALGITALNAMQRAAYATASAGTSLALLSPTGSGKTLAYLLPAISRMTGTQMAELVVVQPSRELAVQSEEVLRRCKTPLRSQCLYGGRPTMEEHRRLREVCPHAVFATPGRLLDHLDKGNLRAETCRLLVVDEYDKCLELGFRDEMARIATAYAAVPQVMLTSATNAQDATAWLQGFRAVQRADAPLTTLDFLTANTPAEQQVRAHRVPSPEKDKLSTLTHLLSHIDAHAQHNVQSIVFVSHRTAAERVGAYLQTHKFAATVYHGGMAQEQRERALYLFRAGARSVLVSTDLASRGLDIPAVGAVIHYHLPLDEAARIHRSGRTARWDQTGDVYYIVGPEEDWPEDLTHDTIDPAQTPVRPSRPAMAVIYIGRGKRDKISRGDIVGFLCKTGGLRGDDIGRIDLWEHHACVAVRHDACRALLQRVAGEKIKGQKTLIEPLRHG